MIDRDSRGRFVKGYKPTDEEELKRLIASESAIKKRSNYIGDLIEKHPYIYNSWRGIRFTEKGKKVGNSEEWNSFKTFYNDVVGTYKKGLVLRRIDNNLPFSKENFLWVTNKEAELLKSNLIWIEYKGEKLPLKQMAEKYGQSLTAIKNRYYKREKYGYSVEEVIFGRKKKRNSKNAKDYLDSGVNIRAKASRMISSYKIKDKKNGFENVCNIDIDWMIENILSKKCVYCGDNRRIGCDRIDNNKPHTKDNVVPCCIECNTARNNNFSFEEMKIIGKAIRKVKMSRKII